jgi:hypothetical protein
VSVFCGKKKWICEVVSDFGGIGGVCRRGSSFSVLVEYIITSEPYGPGESVQSLECQMDAVVAALGIQGGVIERFA